MMQKIQKFGGAMFTPVLLFAFSGIMVGITTLLTNGEIMGVLADPSGMWYQSLEIVKEGAWTVFRQLPLLFVIGLPIGLAKKQPARACLESLVIYLTFNYFLSAILTTWGPAFGVDFAANIGGNSGLALIAGIKTLDTGMIGALVIAGITVYLHDKFYDAELPEFLGVFKGSSFIVIIGFFAMIPLALLFAFIWPKVQSFIGNMQSFFVSSGTIGVWVYTFLERLLIPTGLHHFVYTPFTMDNAVVEGGLTAYWALHLSDFATSSQSLKEMFPQGGFALFGMSKIFAPVGIAAAFYTTAKKDRRKNVLGLMIPVVLTAIVAGITEPIEFTFLFIAPVLFIVHAFLAATLSATAFAAGVVGSFDSGLINWIALNWLPLGKYHLSTYLIQIGIGLLFTVIWFVVFRALILKLNLKTPGREDETEDTKLYSKADYKAKKSAGNSNSKVENNNAKKARLFLEGLGGSENIDSVTNCATRLRITVNNPEMVKSVDEFQEMGAHGLVVKGKAVQVIVGLSVAHVRDELEKLIEEKVKA